MRKLFFSLLLLFVLQSVEAQRIHSLRLGVDGSFGLHYFKQNVDNPKAYTLNLGYQFNLNYFMAVEAGFKFGGFKQTVKYIPDASDLMTKDVYKGNIWGPYLAPKLYIPVGFSETAERAKYIYFEGRFSVLHTRMKADEVYALEETATRNRFNYEFRFGYQYPFSKRWAADAWIGYNTYDFSKVKKEATHYKNNTPLQFGIAFSYILSKRLLK